MPTSVAQQVLAAIVTRAETITTGGGFNHSPAIYTDRAAIDADGDTLPSISIRMDSAIPTRIAMGNRVRNVATVALDLRTRANMLGLVADVQKAILPGDPTLGGIAQTLSERGWDTVAAEVGADVMAVEYVLDVTFDTDHGDPYTSH